MTEPETSSPSSKELFLGLVHSFQAAAMQQMGKIVNPFSQEIERDLPQARLSIDMLLMLQERTSDNLTPEESRFVAHVLRELQLNYVMELEEDQKKSGGGAAPGGSGAPGDAPEIPPAAPPKTP
ncbi:MAG TPA: DUF1844 domain-containing protein [Acidobacteriota bacterium]|nr:DUF1844 domain-containing protein [Acidobacteriota bacterium]